MYNKNIHSKKNNYTISPGIADTHNKQYTTPHGTIPQGLQKYKSSKWETDVRRILIYIKFCDLSNILVTQCCKIIRLNNNAQDISNATCLWEIMLPDFFSSHQQNYKTFQWTYLPGFQKCLLTTRFICCPYKVCLLLLKYD